MNKKDILVGRTYRHRLFPETLYLGVAIRRNQAENAGIIRKDLVVIRCENSEKIGQNVLELKDNKNFWDGFYLTTEN